MNLKFSEKLPAGLVKVIGKTGLWWQRNGSLVLNGCGVVSMMTSTYFGVQAGRKIDAVVEKAKKDVEEARNSGDPKKLKGAKIRAAKDICMVLGLPVGLAVAGAVMVGTGTLKERKQVAGLAAAYCGVLAEYKDLQERAARSIAEASSTRDCDDNEVPIDKATELNSAELGQGKVLVHKEPDNPENKELIFQYDLNSPYEFLFDCRSPQFNRTDVFANLRYLKGMCDIVNIKYDTGTPIFLSEALDALGMDKTKSSLVEGWYKLAPGADPHISFGIEPFLNGDANFSDWEFLKDGIPLRFNVQGPIAYLLKVKDSDI